MVFDADLLAHAQGSSIVREVGAVDLVLTVTSGRSGTGLLTALATDVFGLTADHEPEPRANFALRPALKDPNTALAWLVEEKLPVWAKHAGRMYLEMSHLYCKGLLEPLLALGVRPRLIVLRRPASEVAASLCQMNVIPARTTDGDLVLLRPDDPGVLPLQDWSELPDYGLCFWYAIEIERRQALYRGLRSPRLRTHSVEMTGLLSWTTCLNLARFLGPAAFRDAVRHRSAFRQVTAVNRNPRSLAHPGRSDNPLPTLDERREIEREVLLRTLPYFSRSHP